MGKWEGVGLGALELTELTGLGGVGFGAFEVRTYGSEKEGAMLW